MTYSEALDYIHSVSWKGSMPGLSRTVELCRRLGDPQKRLKFIHIAGTNGKGSTSAMLASVLAAAGYRTGLYTSPFILRFNERMRIDGIDIPDDELAEITAYVRPHADAMEDAPTEFELITAIAFEYFARHGCDYVVLECGMGGRLDSTNVIDAECVALSVITGIAMDHTDFLGDTPEKIAAEKAGIIKAGVPVVFGGGVSRTPTVVDVIRARAEEMGAPFSLVDYCRIRDVRSDLNGLAFCFDHVEGLRIPLLGLYQICNAALVMTVLEVLETRGVVLPSAPVRQGLASVRWHGRFEILSREPLVIFDGGHNPEGVDLAVTSVKHYFGDKRICILSGVMADKDHPYMVSRMSEVAARAFTVRPDNPRALAAETYADEFRRHGIPAEGYETVADAVTAAMTVCQKENTPLLCLGSLYMYGDVRAAVEAYLEKGDIS